ncbi:LemA family protein [bacterium]|nr:LemA family protein [bacterium]
MKARFDLVENLVNTVKGYSIHEKDTLTQIVQARNSFMNAKTDNEKLAANDQLSGVLKTLFAVAEAYPDLKANQNFLQLQTELSDIENKIAAARRFFNSCVKDYNTSIESFPTNIIAKLFGFNKNEFFSITEEEKKAPKVQF